MRNADFAERIYNTETKIYNPLTNQDEITSISDHFKFEKILQDVDSQFIDKWNLDNNIRSYLEEIIESGKELLKSNDNLATEDLTFLDYQKYLEPSGGIENFCLKLVEPQERDLQENIAHYSFLISNEWEQKKEEFDRLESLEENNNIKNQMC